MEEEQEVRFETERSESIEDSSVNPVSALDFIGDSLLSISWKVEDELFTMATCGDEQVEFG